MYGISGSSRYDVERRGPAVLETEAGSGTYVPPCGNVMNKRRFMLQLWGASKIKEDKRM